MTKKPRSRIPEPQIIRILQRHIMGESQRQISREEKRSRPAIARIVKSEEMTEHNQKIWEEFCGLAEDAVSAIRFALQQQKDARAAFQVLQNIGVFVPCQMQGQAAELAEDQLTLEWATRLALMAIEKNKIYGTELPKLEELERTHSLGARPADSQMKTVASGEAGRSSASSRTVRVQSKQPQWRPSKAAPTIHPSKHNVPH